MSLTLKELREQNVSRSLRWDPERSCGIEFAAVELAGEVGEACNAVKKYSRLLRGMKGGSDTIQNLKEELADVIICADLLAMIAGIDLAAAVTAKFNATSVPHGRWCTNENENENENQQ
jgi:NTP pyrophosphatase (non-canonical NTP hydrolase)